MDGYRRRRAPGARLTSWESSAPSRARSTGAATLVTAGGGNSQSRIGPRGGRVRGGRAPDEPARRGARRNPSGAPARANPNSGATESERTRAGSEHERTRAAGRRRIRTNPRPADVRAFFGLCVPNEPDAYRSLADGAQRSASPARPLPLPPGRAAWSPAGAGTDSHGLMDHPKEWLTGKVNGWLPQHSRSSAGAGFRFPLAGGAGTKWRLGAGSRRWVRVLVQDMGARGAQ
jgi:hypothetical protein